MWGERKGDEKKTGNRERGHDAFGARKLVKQALLFRDRILPVLIKGQYIRDYDRQTHQPAFGIPEAGDGRKRPNIIDAYKAQEDRDVEVAVAMGMDADEARNDELKAARVGVSTLFIAEVFASKHDVLSADYSQTNATGLRYEVSGALGFGKKMIDMKKEDFLSLSPEECLQKLKFSLAYTYQEAIKKVFDGHRKKPGTDMAQALELHEYLLNRTEPVKKKEDKVLTPELHQIRGLSTAIIEILSMVEHITDRVLLGAEKAGRKATPEMVTTAINNSYDTIRKLAQLHIQTFSTEQKIFHLDADDTKPLDPRFFRLEKDERNGGMKLVFLEEMVKEHAGEYQEQLLSPDFKDGVTGCPAMLSESLEGANVVEEAFKLFVQKAIELYLPTRFQRGAAA